MQKTSIDTQPTCLWKQPTFAAWGRPKNDYLEELFALPMADNFDEDESSNDSVK